MAALENTQAMLAQASADPQFETMADQWLSMHESAQLIAGMAALATEPMGERLQSFPAELAGLTGVRAFRARAALEDLDAILAPGLAALLAIQSRGQDTTAPALALWREFHASRQSLLRLCDTQL